MPEFVLPAEADHCPYCNAVLCDPPDCCDAMRQEHSEEMHRQNPATVDPWDDVTRWEDEREQYRGDDDEEWDEPARRYDRDY